MNEIQRLQQLAGLAITEAEGDDCEKCRGTGMLDRHSEDPHKCNACDGKGKEKWKPEPPDFNKFFSEHSVEKDVFGHVDNEKDMIMKQLYLMGTQCVELYKLMASTSDTSDYPHWWQGKVIKAAEYLDQATDYLGAELNAPDEPQE